MCFSQYLDVFASATDRLARLCGFIEDRPPIFSTGNNMIVKLNPGWRSSKGFKASVKFVYGPSSGCGGTLRITSTQYIQPPDLEDLHCFWQVWAPRDHQIVIRFTEQNLPSTCVVGNETLSACDCASIEVRDGGGPFSHLINKVCSNQTGSEIRTIAQVAFISFKLHGRKANAFKISVTPETSLCGETTFNVTNAIQVLKTPGYPNIYPEVNCFYHFVAPGYMDKILLHFKDFNLTPETKPHGHEHLTECRGDKVEVVEDVNDNMIWQGYGKQSTFKGSSSSVLLTFYDEKSKHTFCGKDEKPFDYVSTTNSITLFVKPQKGATNRGRGLMLEYSIAGCNRNYTELAGRISNGNNKSDCIISIIVPENRTISLYFNLFFMFRSTNCTDAFFLVRDGSPEGPVLLRTCGYRTPDPIFSFTNKLYIHVKNKDLNRLFVKYDMDYVSTDKGRGCGGEIYNYRGKVFSPMYPNAFKNDTECTWTIKPPVGLHLALKFMKFEIQGSCTDNYLSLVTYKLDQDGQPNSIQTKFCSGDIPVITRSESMTKIIYKSSVTNGGSGWNIIYQAIPPGITDVH